MLKKKIFNKKFSQLVLSITKRIESFFNYYKYSKSSKKKDSNFWNTPLDKKIFIFSGIILIIITYYLLPSFYNKNLVKNQLKDQILKKYNLEVKLDKNLGYGLFPKPHFFVEEGKIIYNTKIISTSKNIKFFISSKDNFKFNKIKLNDLLFLKTDFKINKSNFDFFLNLSNNKVLDGNIKFIKNKLFYLDQNEDVVFFSDLKTLNYMYLENFQNQIESKLSIFNLPVKLRTKHDLVKKNIKTEINFNTLKFKVEDNLDYNDEILKGEIELNFINKNQTVKYSLKDNKLIYRTIDDKFIGDINIKPFFLSSNLNFQNIRIKKIFEDNSILINFLKSEIFYNKNLNGKINVAIDGLNDLNHINKINFNFQFEEGFIFISNLNFIFKDNTIFNFNNVSIIVDENELKLVGDIEINFKDIQDFYSHYQIIRNHRKNIKQITSNFIFSFDNGLFEFNELNIDGIDKKISDQYVNKFNSEKKDILNKVILRNTVKEFFKIISSG